MSWILGTVISPRLFGKASITFSAQYAFTSVRVGENRRLGLFLSKACTYIYIVYGHTSINLRPYDYLSRSKFVCLRSVTERLDAGAVGSTQ